MNKLKILIFLTITLIMGCSSNDDSPSNAFNLDNQIHLSFKNQNGQNLLDNSVEGSYDIENMKLFYLIDNEPVEVTIENGFELGSLALSYNNDKILQVFTNPSSSKVVEETTEYKVVENIAFLQLTQSETDTIKVYSKAGQGYFNVSKVWYNDNLVWTSQSDGTIEIIKP